MKITLKIDGLDDVRSMLTNMPRQVAIASQRALNDTAFAIRQAEMEGADDAFDNVTPYIRNSFTVAKATRENQTAEIFLRYPGGKGVPPEKVLRAEVFGGSRRWKASEKAFQRIGLLPAGWFMTPGPGAPLDAFGNVKPGFITKVMSYFEAFGEQGYKANMTAEGRAKLARRGVTKKGFKTIRGQEFFVSRGTGTTWGPGAHRQHLPAGIYRKSGIHGSRLIPIFFFVSSTDYSPPRFDFFGIGGRTADKMLRQRFLETLAEELARGR